MPKDRDHEEDYEDPLDALLAEAPQALPPMAPDGGFMPQLSIEPEPIPAATAENMACLRGPCRHYVEMSSLFQSGNSRGTLEYVPKQINRFCRAIPGDAIPLTDEVVDECTEWDPLVPADTLARNKRRAAWFKRNPKFDKENE